MNNAFVVLLCGALIYCVLYCSSKLKVMTHFNQVSWMVIKYPSSLFQTNLEYFLQYLVYCSAIDTCFWSNQKKHWHILLLAYEISEHCLKDLTLYGIITMPLYSLKGSRMCHSVKVSLWCVTLLINTRFRFLFQNKQLLSTSDVTLRQRASK